MASQSALIKDTFYCRCAKEFEVKSSAKIKKKKRRECETATDRNCNLNVNRGFQEDDEIQPNTKIGPVLPLSWKLMIYKVIHVEDPQRKKQMLK